MTSEGTEYGIGKPGLVVILVAVISGAGIAFVLASYLLDLSPPWVALLAGAVSGLLGFFILGESIGDAIVFSIVFLVLVFVFLAAGPEIAIVRSTIVPVATGICAGKLTYGIWSETG